MKTKKLTPKQESAIQEFMKNGGNKTAAYRHAYSAGNMKEKTINERACVLFKCDKVATRLKELQSKLEKENEISKEWIIDQLKNVIAKSSQAEMIVDKEGGNSGEFKYDSPGVNKALDTLNKMFGFYAPEKKELSGEVTTRRTINLHPTK